MEKVLDRISADPAVCSGKPCVRGTRIPVYLVLDLLAADEDKAVILRAYPNLTRDDINACIKYGERRIQGETTNGKAHQNH